MNKIVKINTVTQERFEIVREIGRGGSSVVYLVRNTQDGTQFAMKLLNKEMMPAEAEILKKLGKEGSGIPAYYGALLGDCPEGSDGSITGFVMEYIEGDSLQKILDGGRIFTVREAAEAGLSFCAILKKLHGLDPPLIYRDFKPANILTRKDGSYVLIDYGACRTFKAEAARDTKMLGTEGYAAPEQYGGWEQSDVRTDIYGIGAVLHHMLTGRHPLETGLGPVAELMRSPDESQKQMDKLQDREIDREMNKQREPGLYREMDKVLRRCCSVSPDMRFSGCAGLEKALRKVLEACSRAEKAAGRGKGKSDKAAGHGTEKPEAVREQMWKKFLVLAACAVTFLFGSGMFSVSAAGAGMARYHMFIREGKAMQGADAQKGCYLQAVRLRPTDSEAYAAFLTDLASDGVITQKERETFEDLLYTEDFLAEMRVSAPSQYAVLELEIGKQYWGCYEGGTEPACQAIESAVSAGVPLGKRKMAQAMQEILNGTPSEERVSAWYRLQLLAREEAAQTGSWNFALIVSRAALTEIALRADLYWENGEEAETAGKVLEEAERLYKPFQEGRLQAPERLTQALREAIEAAQEDQRGRISQAGSAQ